MTNLKSAVFASFVAVCGSNAFAQDAATVLDWSGAYYGAALGYADTGSTFDNGAGGLTTPTFDVNGGTGSVFVGYNWQDDKVVYGFEADITSADVSGSFAPGPCSSTPGCITEINSMISVRGRVGYAVGAALYYTSFGIVVADVDSALTATASSDSSSRISPLLAIGGEWSVGQGWNIRAEYSTMDFGKEPGPLVGPTNLNVGLDRIDLFRIGFSRKF